jgi:hypothetical protein
MKNSFLLPVALIILVAASGASVGARPSYDGSENLTVAAAGETQTCPRCGYENKAGLNYCVKCGASLKEGAPGEKITCPQCGAKNSADANFCTKCGYCLKPEKAGVRPPTAPRLKKGVYFTGGLASYRGAELMTKNWYAGGRHGEIDMGRSWAVGGGFILPLWSSPGVVPLSFELASDAGFNKIYEEFEFDFLPYYHPDLGYENSFISIRENVIFGVAVGPGKRVKPFCGFGGGVAVFMWEAKDLRFYEAAVLDEGTSIKPLFDIPFGCEFQLTPHFALGAKADYLVILGDTGMEWRFFVYDVDVNTSVPDVFLFGGTARLCF